MKATVRILPKAEAELWALSPRDLHLVVDFLEFISLFPLGAQSAEFDEAPDVRRGVAGDYLIYYRFESLRRTVLVHTVRHGARIPMEPTELGPL